MDEGYGVIIGMNPDTQELLEGLPETERIKIDDFMYILNNKYAVDDIDDFMEYIKNVFEMLKSNIVDYTCFTMACNWILWDSYEEDPQKAKIFEKIWMDFDSKVDNLFTNEDLQYYYRLTD